ncbi:hypothetical protein BDR04DRAFT_563118 [Suillus decipiens]|nr:hypothetical protein BDR04DRAFT_563118 [Suillus decipiens]
MTPSIFGAFLYSSYSSSCVPTRIRRPPMAVVSLTWRSFMTTTVDRCAEGNSDRTPLFTGTVLQGTLWCGVPRGCFNNSGQQQNGNHQGRLLFHLFGSKPYRKGSLTMSHLTYSCPRMKLVPPISSLERSLLNIQRWLVERLLDFPSQCDESPQPFGTPFIDYQ